MLLLKNPLEMRYSKEGCNETSQDNSKSKDEIFIMVPTAEAAAEVAIFYRGGQSR